MAGSELLAIVLIIAAIVLALVSIVIAISKKKGGAGEAEAIAEIAAAKVIEELRAQRVEAQGEAREQRKEAADMAQAQRAELADVLGKSNAQTAQLIQASLEATQKSLADLQTGVRDKVDERLDAIQKSNEKKLDEMRKTVDEKLEATLNTRLKNSFDTVSQQLEAVNVRLGELGTVAESVSSLNKTLSGSKTRGILGELQLSQIIEDMLPSKFYEKEAQIGARPGDRVEFAVKFPGQDDNGYVYLPIDSKFPLEPYYKLLDGFEKGDAAAVTEGRKELLTRIKTFAADVKKKYINPPVTTDFAILFLPTEGLYAEAVRDAAFLEELSKQGIMLAGPMTLSAMLSSLLLGFKTLQIQEGAADIKRALEFAKAEFGKFGEVLVKAQSRIRQTGEELDELVGARTKKINKALENVQLLDYEEEREGEGSFSYDKDEGFAGLELLEDD